MTSSNGNIFRVTGPLCGEFTGPGEFPTQMCNLICVWINGWVNNRMNREAGDLRRHRSHYDVNVMVRAVCLAMFILHDHQHTQTHEDLFPSGFLGLTMIRVHFADQIRISRRYLVIFGCPLGDDDGSYSWVHIIHYCDVIMGAMASQTTSLTIVYSTVYSGADQRKHKSSASLAFVWGNHRWPANSPHKWPVTWKMFPFDDVIMINAHNWQCFVLLLSLYKYIAFYQNR